MNKRLKIVIIVLLVIGLTGFVGYNYVMHGGARDLESEDTAFTVTSEAITNEFTTNIDLSNKKYLEKPIAISGTITSINNTEVIIDNSIICNLKSPDKTIKKNLKATVKGRVVGYDDLMGELKLDQCFIIKN
jgi:flagellar basal body-associated protein FliL